jgi:hypothetical protein
MRKITLALAIGGAMSLGALYTAPAYAQATRTWISGVGDDVNPCSRTAPCKTWAGAISKTAAGGEIDALDPGGFGAVTIVKAMTLDGGGGQVASTLAAGTNGIVVSAQPTDVVIIRNVRINGALQTANPGVNGILFNSGAKLSVEKCEIFGWNTAGVSTNTSATSQVNIIDTDITNVAGTAIKIAGNGAAVSASLNNVHVFGGGTTALTVNGGATAMVNHSVFTGSGLGLDIEGGATVNVNDSRIDHNGTGIFNSASTVRLSNSDVAFNGTGVSGTVMSFTNNRFSSNGAGGTITAIGGPSNPTGQQ